MLLVFVWKSGKEKHNVSSQMVDEATSAPTDETTKEPGLPKGSGATEAMAPSAPNLLEKVNTMIMDMQKSGLRDQLLERIGIDADGKFKENRSYM